MEIGLNNHKNLCKDARQKQIVSRDDKEKSVGKKCEHRAINNRNCLVRHYQVNGDILTDGKKCDFLVLNDDDKFAYLIELKRKKFLEGMEQVKTSHQKIKSALPDYQFLFRIVHAGTNIHAVRSQEVVRWRESHGRTPEGKTIADLKKTPYIENI